jgi:hypothetical protein
MAFHVRRAIEDIAVAAVAGRLFEVAAAAALLRRIFRYLNIVQRLTDAHLAAVELIRVGANGIGRGGKQRFLLGFVEGSLSLPNIAFIKFKAEVKDGMNLFGILVSRQCSSRVKTLYKLIFLKLILR